MIITAQALFMIEGSFPREAEQRLAVLGKEVRLVNANLWQFQCEFRTDDAFQGEFQGNETFTAVMSSFTLSNACAMAERAVTTTLEEFRLRGEVRVVSATNEHPVIIVKHIKRRPDMKRDKLPPEKRGKNADNANTSKGRTDNSKAPRGMTEQERKDMTGRNPEKPIAGSQRWADKHGK